MKTEYHIEITHLALEKYFSSSALNVIVAGNLKQDKLRNQIGHDYIHFDGSAFEPGFNYIAEQEQLILQYLQSADALPAWNAFGKIIHSWQDFFSHSNYVQLWSQKHPHRAPQDIEINDTEILQHPELASGKNYGPIELIATLPGLNVLLMPLMPRDSHAHMNLDAPSAGPFFEFTYWAAMMATENAYTKTSELIKQVDHGGGLIKVFKGQVSHK